MDGKIRLGDVEVEVEAVRPDRYRLSLHAHFTLDDLMGFLDDLRVAAEDVVSRTEIS